MIRLLPASSAKRGLVLVLVIVSFLVTFSLCTDLFFAWRQSRRPLDKPNEPELQAEPIPPKPKLPTLCPPSIVVAPDAVLTFPMAPFTVSDWSVDVSVVNNGKSEPAPEPGPDDGCGAGEIVDAEQVSCRPGLGASLRWEDRDGRMIRVMEVSALGPEGPETLASVTSNFDVALGSGAGHHFGQLRLVSSGKYVLMDANNESVMAISCDALSRRVEMASLPEGRLVATAVRTCGIYNAPVDAYKVVKGGAADDSIVVADQDDIPVDCDRLEISLRRGADAAFALACALAVLAFAPPRRDGSLKK